MQLRGGGGHLIALESVEQRAADHGELREAPPVEITGEHGTFHLDIGDAIVVQPAQPAHLGFRGLQTDRPVQTELLEEELIAGHRLGGHDLEVGVLVGGDDRLRGRRRESSIEPVLTGAAIEQSVGLEISHEPFGGDDDGAAGQSDTAAGADPAPEHLVHGIKIAGLEKEHHAHEFLQSDRGTRHTHTVRGEQHAGGVAGDEAVLFGESDDLRARVEFAPPLREFLNAPAGSGHDDRFDIAQFGQHRIGGRHPEVVIDILMAAVHNTIEKRVIDVLGLQLRPPRFRMTRRNLRVT